VSRRRQYRRAGVSVEFNIRPSFGSGGLGFGNAPCRMPRLAMTSRRVTETVPEFADCLRRGYGRPWWSAL